MVELECLVDSGKLTIFSDFRSAYFQPGASSSLMGEYTLKTTMSAIPKISRSTSVMQEF